MSTEACACERLAMSRERLRQALQHPSLNDTAGSHPAGLLASLLGHLQSASGTGLVEDVLQAWWQKQPLRVTAMLAMEATKLLVQPIARRSPYTLVLSAAAVGGLTVLLRPWRWISTPALLAGLLPQVLSEAIKTRPPKPGGATST